MPSAAFFLSALKPSSSTCLPPYPLTTLTPQHLHPASFSAGGAWAHPQHPDRIRALRRSKAAARLLLDWHGTEAEEAKRTLGAIRREEQKLASAGGANASEGDSSSSSSSSNNNNNSRHRRRRSRGGSIGGRDGGSSTRRSSGLSRR